MSESAIKSAKGRKKKMPKSLVLTLNTPITKRNVVSVSTGGFTPKESENEAEGCVERSKKRKIRRTDHSLYVPKEDEAKHSMEQSKLSSNKKIKRRLKNNLMVNSENSSDDVWASSVEQEASEKAEDVTCGRVSRRSGLRRKKVSSSANFLKVEGNEAESSEFETCPSSPQIQPNKRKGKKVSKNLRNTPSTRSKTPSTISKTLSRRKISKQNLTENAVDSDTKDDEDSTADQLEANLRKSINKILKLEVPSSEQKTKKIKRKTIAIDRIRTPISPLKPRKSMRKRWSDDLKNELANNSNIIFNTKDVPTHTLTTSTLNEPTTSEYDRDVLKPRLSRRKRWSDGLRNESSFTLDIASNVKNDSIKEQTQSSAIRKSSMSSSNEIAQLSPKNTSDVPINNNMNSPTLQSKSISSSTSISMSLPENEINNSPVNSSGTRKSKSRNSDSSKTAQEGSNSSSMTSISIRLSENDMNNSPLNSSGNRKSKSRISASSKTPEDGSNSSIKKRRSKSLGNDTPIVSEKNSFSDQSVRRSKSFRKSSISASVHSMDCIVIDDTLTPESEEQTSQRSSILRRTSTNFTPNLNRESELAGPSRMSTRYKSTPHPVEKRRDTYELEESVMDSTLLQALAENPSRISERYQPTPLPLKKRRDTYELQESVTDTTLLKSLSVSNNSNLDSELPKNLDNTKKVRFRHVTMRRKHRNNTNDDVNSSLNRAEVPSVNSRLKKSVSFDQTLFSPSTASTPFVAQKHNFAQEILARNMKSNDRRRSRSAEEYRSKPVARTRMPDFARLHQKAADKMESIDELSKRKAERARILLSGQKPPTSSPKEKMVKKSHKQLDFNNMPSTSGVIKTVLKAPSEIVLKKDKQLETKNLLVPSKSRYGFKVKDETKENKNVQMKAIANKTKPTKETSADKRDENRTILKGVRGNRRFELLMKMRQKN